MTYTTDTLELAEAEVRKHAGHGAHGGCVEAAFLRGFDAALATVTPRTISAAAELDALRFLSVVTDPTRLAWQKIYDGRWQAAESNYYAIRTSAELYDRAPLTLLVPATAAPEPVRLTADDPRWKDGAKVRGEFANGSAIEGTVLNGMVAVASDVDPTSWSRRGLTVVYLLAEAPADPDAEVLEALRMTQGIGCTLQLSDLRERGYDVVKVER